MNNHPRNAPCYCGSGKKYKNCCLRIDQEANNAQLIKINLPQAGVDDFSEDHAIVVNENDQNEASTQVDIQKQTALEVFWNKFDAASDEEQIILLDEALNETDFLDGDTVFESFLAIAEYLETISNRDAFAQLVHKLKLTHFNVYVENSDFLLSNCIKNAIVAQRPDEVKALVREWRQFATSRSIDDLLNVARQLAFYEQIEAISLLVAPLHQEILDANNILLGDDSDFVAFGLYAFYDQLVAQGQPLTIENPTLLAQINTFYPSPNLQNIESELRWITGDLTNEWTLADFKTDIASNRTNHDEISPFEMKIRDFFSSFVHFLCTTHHFSISKAILAADVIRTYVLQQKSGDIKLKSSQTSKNKKLKKLKDGTPAYFFIPNYATMDMFLGELAVFFNLQYYLVAQFVEAIPFWLKFLLQQKLIDFQQFNDVIVDIQKIQEEILTFFEKYTSDPLIAKDIEKWMWNATLKP